MTAKTETMSNDDDCSECGGRLRLDSHRGELECVVCGLTQDAPAPTMNHVPEGYGTTRTGNPYHKQATGSTIGTGFGDMRDVPAHQRAMYRRIALHNKFAKPSPPQHTATKVWDLIAETNGQALANAMYDANMLDDLLRPVRPDHKGSTMTKRAEAILAEAEEKGVHLVQPSGQWSRSTSTGATPEEREASKLSTQQKEAILAAACVSIYGALYPGAPTNVATVQKRLLELTGLEMAVAKKHLQKATKYLTRHLRDLAGLGFFSPRARNAAAHAHWVDEQVGLHLAELQQFLASDKSLAPYVDDLIRDAAVRLDGMRHVDTERGVDSPYLHLPPVKRAGLAVYSALHAEGLERGRRAGLATTLVLCDDTIPLLRERLLEAFEEGLDPVA